MSRFFIVGLLAIFSLFSWAQAWTSQPDSETVFDLGLARVIPGARARVALMFFLSDQQKTVKEAEHLTCFSDPQVRLLEVETGLAAQNAEAVIHQEIEEKEGETCLMLRVLFDREAVSGTLATLVFSTDENALVDHVITLRGEAQMVGEDGAIPATAREGEIRIVEIDPIFGCFFYLH